MNSQLDCTAGWSPPMSGQFRFVPYGPDMYATYWYYCFTRQPGDTFGIRLTGQFAHARFMSYNVYNDQGDFINPPGGPPSSILDTSIVPDPGCLNPFWLAVDRGTPERTYTVVVVPEGSPTNGAANVITFSADAPVVSIYLRVYVADPDLTGRHRLSGGVPLPTLEAFDPATGRRVACPPTQGLQGGSKGSMPPANSGGTVKFYRASGGGLYPNGDAAYLFSIFNPVGDSVAVIRMKRPTFTHTEQNPDGILRAAPMVRYWSFNVYSQLTNVTACLPDFQAQVDARDDVTLVLARRHPRVMRKVEEEGWNFLPWGDHDQVGVTYRNLVANPAFPYSAYAVPEYDGTRPLEGQSAELYMREYAPQGILCSVEEFLNDGVLAAA